jgi:type IV secretory pathway ATPase VirB11/archaellum biosynthesis ATPase
VGTNRRDPVRRSPTRFLTARAPRRHADITDAEDVTTTILAPGELADLVERMLRTSRRRIDMSQPFVDAIMPDGSRLHVVIPMTTWLAGRSVLCRGVRDAVAAVPSREGLALSRRAMSGV